MLVSIILSKLKIDLSHFPTPKRSNRPVSGFNHQTAIIRHGQRGADHAIVANRQSNRAVLQHKQVPVLSQMTAVLIRWVFFQESI